MSDLKPGDVVEYQGKKYEVTSVDTRPRLNLMCLDADVPDRLRPKRGITCSASVTKVRV